MENKIPPSLVWACRRGMLELDILLGNFLHQRYPSLSEDDQALFVQLLNNNDQDLIFWLKNQALPSEKALLPLIEMIRTHARSRHSIERF